MYEYYLNKLKDGAIPEYLIKYLACPSLERLKNVGYFCGMDYASKSIYHFSEYISRFDHSLTVALLISKFTNNKEEIIAGLLHDIATPCFSHVIDYMNGDFETQESTEKYTEKIILSDKQLLSCIKEDNLSLARVINFKNYSLVDTERPKLCADRLDGIILTAIGWTKNITLSDIDEILANLIVCHNEYNELELSFNNPKTAKKVLAFNNIANTYCHSKEDNYMMLLLAKITKLAINNNYLTYDNLYEYDEKNLFKVYENINNDEIRSLLKEFKTINISDIPDIETPKIKERILAPMVKKKQCKRVVV